MAIVGLSGANDVRAQDLASMAVGRATGVTAVQASVAWLGRDDDPRWRWLHWTGASPRLEATLSVWRGTAGGVSNATLVGISLQPLLRWRFAPRAPGRPFVDFGLGPRVWSGTRVGSNHTFGTAFEFGTVLGLGLQRKDLELFARIEHTSNGGIRQPNPGINFLLLGVAWPLSP